MISTLNEDGSPNLAPMSSAWWLGWSCMLGLGAMGKTSEKLHVEESLLADSAFMTAVRGSLPSAPGPR